MRGTAEKIEDDTDNRAQIEKSGQERREAKVN